MAAGKDLIVLCIDIGPSMGVKSIHDDSPLDLSLRIAATMIEQKLFYPSKDEFSLVLFGTKETANELADDEGSYANISVVMKFSQPDLSLLQYLSDKVRPSDVSSDFLDALIVSLDLFQKVSGRINAKKIYMFTDAGCTFDDEDLNLVLNGLHKHNVDLNIVGPDLSSPPEPHSNGSDQGGPGPSIPPGVNNRDKMVSKTKAQRAGEDILKRIVSQGDFSSFSFSEALKALTHIKKTQLRQTTVFRGDIEIGPDFRIPTYGYLRVKENKLTSWKKLSAISQASTNPGTMEVTTSRSYHLGDEEQTEISKDQMVKGFRFGKDLIPFSKYDIISTKGNNNKCLQVIGFSQCSHIKRHHFIGDSVVTFVPPTSECSQGFSALAQSLFEMDCVAIVRYCFRQNASPKLGCLYPHIRPDYTELLFFQLPFAEDIREFTFGSLDESGHSHEEIESMDQFLSSMDLSQAYIDSEGDRSEAFQPRFCPNPHIHRLFQCTSHRSLNKGNELPKLDPIIADYLNPSLPNRENIQACIKLIQGLCPLIEIESKKTDKSDIFKKEIGGDKQGNEEQVEDMDISEVLSSDVSNVGSINPVKDFEEMCKKTDLFPVASKQMQERIVSLVRESFGDQNYPKALSCITSLREVCISLAKPETFNEFAKSLRVLLIGSGDASKEQRHQAFLTLIVKEGITLISKEECECDVTGEEAKQFLSTLEPVAGGTPSFELVDDEVDDLLENM